MKKYFIVSRAIFALFVITALALGFVQQFTELPLSNLFYGLFALGFLLSGLNFGVSVMKTI